MHHFTLNRVLFLFIVSIKVKTLKSLSTITDRLTDRQKDRCVHNDPRVPNTGVVQIGQTKHYKIFFLNTSSITVAPQDKCSLQ